MIGRPTSARFPSAAVLAFLATVAVHALAQPVPSVLSLAQKERPILIDTMKELVEIESGSADREGLDRIADLIAVRLEALGGQVEMIEA